ncbi:MAG: protein translocase subunit SecD [Alphaproteobacteria bacterium]
MVYFPTWKVVLILSAILVGVICALPNVLSRSTLDGLPGWLPRNQITLGLDLQGGAHLAFQVEADDVVTARLDTLEDEVRAAILRARLRLRGLGIRGDRVVVQMRDAADVPQVIELARDLAQPVTSAFGGFGASSNLVIEGVGADQVSVGLSDAAITQLRDSAILQSIETIRRRIDETGVREPTIQREGEDRIIVQVPGLDDPQRIIDLVGRTARLEFHMHDSSVPVSEAVQGRVPPGSAVYPTVEAFEPQILLRKRVLVSGENLIDSQPSFDPETNEPVVTFRFDSTGARRFADATRKSVGKRFAIVLDGEVISAPVIRDPILSGSGQIAGSFTVESANDLSILLRSGALPAPLTPVEQRTVGAGLGQDSIDAGKIAAMIGLTGVVIFMALTYGLFGLYANVALLINLVLIAGAMSFLGFTLTLPGIAGIVLTIGMAVDANVLIFERIREEIRAGKGPISAIEAGYQRAFGTILDANITTLIAAVILFQLGSGPVRGFALTLAIGIVTSVFTAFTVTRLMVATWLRRARPQALPI